MALFSTKRWPYVISGTGLVLGLSLLIELVLTIVYLENVYPALYLGTVTSLPFILGIIYSGYWLSKSDLPHEQYDRVGRWWIASSVLTTLMVFVINLQLGPMSVMKAVGTVRWSASVGSGFGLMIGIFRAGAAMQAVLAERAKSREQKVQRERDRLDEFAGIVSHDLRNPLNVAQGNLELLAKENDSQYIENISAAHERMSAIIDNMLTLARAGQAVDEMEPVELSSIVTTCWQGVETANATLTTADTARINADRDRLQQLFENLFRNAIEHVGETVTIRVGVLEDGAGFYVEDDGPGIPESKRKSVFEAGYSTSTDGTGLGLNIVKTIVEAHEWEITVTESDDGGARFEISNVEITDA